SQLDQGNPPNRSRKRQNPCTHSPWSANIWHSPLSNENRHGLHPKQSAPSPLLSAGQPRPLPLRKPVSRSTPADPSPKPLHIAGKPLKVVRKDREHPSRLSRPCFAH